MKFSAAFAYIFCMIKFGFLSNTVNSKAIFKKKFFFFLNHWQCVITGDGKLEIQKLIRIVKDAFPKLAKLKNFHLKQGKER